MFIHTICDLNTIFLLTLRDTEVNSKESWIRSQIHRPHLGITKPSAAFPCDTSLNPSCLLPDSLHAAGQVPTCSWAPPSPGPPVTASRLAPTLPMQKTTGTKNINVYLLIQPPCRITQRNPLNRESLFTPWMSDWRWKELKWSKANILNIISPIWWFKSHFRIFRYFQ